MAEESNEIQALRAQNTQLKRAVDELSILNELASAVAASRDVEEVIQTIIRRSLSSVGAEQGVVTLIGHEDSDPTKTLVRTMAGSAEGEAFSPDQSLLGWMHLNKRPLLINDPFSDDRFRGIKWPQTVRSVLCVPMVVKSRLIGILTLYNKKRGLEGFAPTDQRLIAILAAQSAQMVESARLYDEERKLVQMQQEMRLAHEIQSNLLPSSPPSIAGYEFAGTSIPAKEVGGDYFDFIPMNDGRLGLTVGDVSGKGIPAALLMASTQGSLRGQVVRGQDPAQSLERTNQLLCSVARKGTFVTLFLAMLDVEEHRFTYANAGHNRPIVVRRDGTIETLTLGSLVLGFLPTHTYKSAERVLEPGETLIIYSDGVTEAMNPDSEQFDEERLYKIATKFRDRPASDLVQRVVRQVERFAGARPQSDDITLLVARRLPEA